MAFNKRTWDLVEARYKSGEKVTIIAGEMDMAPDTICRRAKKFGWTQGENLELIDKEIKLIKAKIKLNPQEKSIHDEKVHEMTADALMIHGLTKNNMSGLKKKIDTIDKAKGIIDDHKVAQDTIDKASVTLNVNPRFSAPNQVNVQNNNTTNVFADLSDEDLDRELDELL